MHLGVRDADGRPFWRGQHWLCAPSKCMQSIQLVVLGSGLGNLHGVEVGSSYAAAALPGAPQGSAPPISTANQPPAGQQSFRHAGPS